MQNTDISGKIIIKIVFKSCALAVMLFILVLFLKATVEAGYDDWDKSKSIDVCNRYYYEKKYGELMDHMCLFDTYDEEFDVYWEMADAYRDCVEYEQWASITEEEFPGSSEMAEKYRQKIIDNTDNCRFEENRTRLEELREKYIINE